jgi:hypothetical protein
MNRQRAITIVAVAWLLFAALQLNTMATFERHPYSLYTTGRFVVCGAWVLSALVAYHRKWWFGCAAAAAVALVFNPFLPVHMTRYEWRPWDIAGMLASLVAAAFLGWTLWRERSGEVPPSGR